MKTMDKFDEKYMEIVTPLLNKHFPNNPLENTKRGEALFLAGLILHKLRPLVEKMVTDTYLLGLARMGDVMLDVFEGKQGSVATPPVEDILNEILN